jgi:hypothetical protein
VSDESSLKVKGGQQLELRGRADHEPHPVIEKLEAFQADLEVGFALGLPCTGDLAAEPAGMLPIEGFANGGAEGFAMGAVREHGGPRHGLQDEPVPADRAEQRDAQHPIAEAGKHTLLVGRARGIVKSRKESGIFN